MPNERLRAALLERGLTPAALGDELGVDQKTVERWIAAGSPTASTATRSRPGWAWTRCTCGRTRCPRDQVAAASDSEVLAIYPHRSDVPRESWERLFAAAERRSACSSTPACSWPRTPVVQKILADKARAGVRVRILLGDPDSPQVAERGVG